MLTQNVLLAALHVSTSHQQIDAPWTTSPESSECLYWPNGLVGKAARCINLREDNVKDTQQPATELK